MHIINGDAPGQSAPGRSKSGYQKEKSAWLQDTAEADYEEQSDRSLPAAEDAVNEAPKPPETPKVYETLRAQFALRGCVLTRSHRVGDGRVNYVVTSWAGARYFSHLHDVQGHLSQITDRVRIYAKGGGDGL